MRTPAVVLGSCALCLVVVACVRTPAAPLNSATGSTQASPTEITRKDLFVPHVSTVPANAGETVRIAVRHVTPKLGEATHGPVLFTTPGVTSAVATLDLDYQTYSLSAAVAAQGFDVYVMDHTGIGRSPHPTMDDPCNGDPEQQHLLIPNPLRQACAPTYPHHLVTIFTEVAEIASVVDYIRKQTGRQRVSLAGWSRALSRFGLYAAQHPEKVEKIAIVGPGYRRDAPSDFPTATAGPSAQPRRTAVPQFSFFLRTADEIFRPWQSQRQCEDTVDPGVYDALVTSVRMHADPGAATWGTPPGTYYRVPAGSQVDAGWNRPSAQRVTAPVLLVVGEHDPRFAEEAPNLYADLASRERILLKVQCATHFLLFERNHRTVHRAFAEFLAKGTVNGRRGVISVDRTGDDVPGAQTVLYSNEGVPLEAHLYKPAGTGPFPLVIHVHSGPDTAAWGAVVARVLGDAGYATMISGIRGQPFEPAMRVEGMKRAVGDMLAALEHVTRDSAYRVDAQRVAIMGYSAGGTVAVLAGAASDRFRGVIAQAPSSVGWSDEPALREAVTAAARRLRVPTLCLVAENDNTTESARSVCDWSERERRPGESDRLSALLASAAIHERGRRSRAHGVRTSGWHRDVVQRRPRIPGAVAAEVAVIFRGIGTAHSP